MDLAPSRTSSGVAKDAVEHSLPAAEGSPVAVYMGLWWGREGHLTIKTTNLREQNKRGQDERVSWMRTRLRYTYSWDQCWQFWLLWQWMSVVCSRKIHFYTDEPLYQSCAVMETQRLEVVTIKNTKKQTSRLNGPTREEKYLKGTDSLGPAGSPTVPQSNVRRQLEPPCHQPSKVRLFTPCTNAFRCWVSYCHSISLGLCCAVHEWG
jgi:hypothetical protein